MKPLTLLVLNSLSLVFTLTINYLGGTGKYFQNSVGEISSLYPTAITPAAYAFSIWGLIYLALTAFLIYQWYTYATGRQSLTVIPTGIWFTFANLANAFWVWAWTAEYLLLSVLLISLLLFSLVRLILRLRLEIYDAPLQVIFWVWWPVCIYTGWIVLATVLNIAVSLKSFNLLSGAFSETVWAVLLLIVAGIIYIWITLRRNMREAALVGAWGLVAIAAKQGQSYPKVAFSAIAIAGLLLIITVIHAYRNRKTSPIVKLIKGEWT
ncbi:hypothetical protein SAMN04488057_103215 [Cyclobacterium lianum]|uniref:TspO and MBR related proteins n=1 Tax=Cyclobacterium lianum TaxID=388280 RepID=A0A1M7LBF5_9BACT|nr:hypothetical protein [Cyclobacterium lianum]SHM75473.1 hypothetical protein SAMN04488057_103215 [Cyclobacterium lianum]